MNQLNIFVLKANTLLVVISKIDSCITVVISAYAYSDRREKILTRNFLLTGSEGVAGSSLDSVVALGGVGVKVPSEVRFCKYDKNEDTKPSLVYKRSEM